jgi:hypothetical protein
MGLVFSPNGQTANCENMTVEYVRVYNTKAFFVGCQAQEKLNSFTNIYCWGRTHTMFQWGGYGNGTPGQYYIRHIGIAGGVVKLLNRISGGYYSLIIDDVNAEMLGSIGQWQSNVGDKLMNATIGFAPLEATGAFPAFGHVYGQQNATGILFDNCNIRYYGKPNLPILLNGNYPQINCIFPKPPMWGYKSTDSKPGYWTDMLGFTDSIKISKKLAPGTIVAYCNPSSWIWDGLGIAGADSTVQNVSPNIVKGKNEGVRKKVDL